MIGKRKALINQIIESSEEEPEEFQVKPFEGNFNLVVSTGSTLLNLAISGGRIHGGGIPAGIILEVYGPPSIGKTAVLSEIAGNVQKLKGEVRFLDPEARMDKEHARIYGIALDKKNYFMPNTVNEVFEMISAFRPKNTNTVNAICTDSLAALTTEKELDGKDGMGMARGKDFSSGLRVTSRQIKQDNTVVPCSNQLRYGDKGEFTPGGMGIPFYASLRIKLFPVSPYKITKKKKIQEGEISGEFDVFIGTKVGFEITKSSVDTAYRKGFFFIIDGYGIDDIRGNLQFNKDVTEDTKYDCCGNDKKYVAMDRAIKYVEAHNLEDALRKRTIKLWYKLQRVLKGEERKSKHK